MTPHPTFPDLVRELKQFNQAHPGILPKELPEGITALTEIQDTVTDPAAKQIIDRWIARQRHRNRIARDKWKARQLAA